MPQTRGLMAGEEDRFAQVRTQRVQHMEKKVYTYIANKKTVRLSVASVYNGQSRFEEKKWDCAMNCVNQI